MWKTKDIMKSPSFHGVMTGREAELTLEKHGSNKCYLTRYDETRKLCILTVKMRGEKRFIHFMINIIGDETNTHYELMGTSKMFDTISGLIHFYENNPVNFEVNSIGDAVLTVPHVDNEPDVSHNSIANDTIHH